MAGPAGECPACPLCPQAGVGHQGSLLPLLLCLFPLRCYELELQGCSLQDLFVIVSRQQPSLQETSFTCLLGEVRVSAWPQLGGDTLPSATLVLGRWWVPALTLTVLWFPPRCWTRPAWRPPLRRCTA